MNYNTYVIGKLSTDLRLEEKQNTVTFKPNFNRDDSESLCIGIERIVVGEDGSIVISPGRNDHEVISPTGHRQNFNGATCLAILMRRYGISINSQATGYGSHSLTLLPGQAPKVLSVLIKHGFGQELAEHIADDNDMDIAAPRGVRVASHVADENFNR